MVAYSYSVELMDRHGHIRAKAVCDVTSDSGAAEAAEQLAGDKWAGFNFWDGGRLVRRRLNSSD